MNITKYNSPNSLKFGIKEYLLYITYSIFICSFFMGKLLVYLRSRPINSLSYFNTFGVIIFCAGIFIFFIRSGKNNYTFKTVRTGKSQLLNNQLMMKFFEREQIDYKVLNRDVLLIAELTEKVLFFDSKLAIIILFQSDEITYLVHRRNDQILPLRPKIEESMVKYINSISQS